MQAVTFPFLNMILLIFFTIIIFCYIFGGFFCKS